MTINELLINKVDPAMFDLPLEVVELVKKKAAPATQPASQPIEPAPENQDPETPVED
jgi:hypothetical protein